MILINLLPPEFRTQTERRGPPWVNARLGKIGGVCFLLLTIIFYVHYLFALQSLHDLESRWKTIQQDLQRVVAIKTAMESGSKGERSFLENYISLPYRTTQILNAVSQLIPDSIWLVELRVSRRPKENTLILKGVSLPSRDQTSVQEIEKYLRDLKGSFPADAELALTTSRQQRERTELTLFTAVFRWS